MRWLGWLLALGLLGGAAWGGDVVTPGITLYVSTRGDDAWSGTRATARGGDGPFATLERARDAIRALKGQGGLPRGGVRVVLAPGVYRRTASFTLTADDSGTPEAPIVYTGPTRGTAVLSGGQALNGFTPVTAPAISRRFDPAVRDRVRQCDLRAQQITDFGELTSRGHGRTGDHLLAPLELFFRGHAMQLARWPNAGVWANDGWLVNTLGTREACLGYTGDRPRRWASDTDIWVHGFWGSEWHFTTQPVLRIDRDARRIYPSPAASIGGNDRFYVVNVLEELDTPGEYYLDRETGLLYFLPPATIRDGDAVVSLLRAPLLELHDVQHVSFERLTLTDTRASAARITGGRGVTLAGCTIRNTGTDGVRLLRGFDHRIISCDFTATGDCGVYVEAGDRAQLIPANHTVHNCHFFAVSRLGQTYKGAVGVKWEGVMGLRLTHNLIHDLNHTGIFFFGNDIVMEDNELYNCVLQGDDAGAVYTGRDWTFQGNVFRHNYLHHNGSSGRHPVYGSMGLYHDDAAGGTRVEDNIFAWVSKAVFAGGGINTRVENNYFIDCAPAYWIDERGVSGNIGGFMQERFDSVHAGDPRWAERYPNFRVVQDAFRHGTGIPPVGNSFTHNIVAGSPRKWMIAPWPEAPDYLPIEHNMLDADPRFADPAWGDYRLRPDSPALDLGIQPIDVAGFGLVKDAYRTAIERVESRLELVAPLTLQPDGSARGLVRLHLRNRGDVTVKDVEYIGAKCMVTADVAGFYYSLVADAAQVTNAFWRFSLSPGQHASRDFPIVVDGGAIGKFDVVEINSRGMRARPARLRATVVSPLEAGFDGIGRLRAGAEPTHVRLTVCNQGDRSLSDTLNLTVVPPDVAGADPASFPVHLAPGESVTREVAVTLHPDAPGHRSRVTLQVAGRVLRETEQTLFIAQPLPRLTETPALEAVADTLARVPAQRLYLDWAGQTGPVAEARFVLAPGALLLTARVTDPRVQVADPLWMCSHLELFAARVPGASSFAQLFLVPASGDTSARGYRIHAGTPVADASIQLLTVPTGEGYVLSAIIPLTVLDLAPTLNEVALELSVTASDDAGTMGARRGTLFGSPKAFTESDGYGLFTP